MKFMKVITEIHVVSQLLRKIITVNPQLSISNLSVNSVRFVVLILRGSCTIWSTIHLVCCIVSRE